jgi:multidrug efflux pump subunit AcrA (membrane-fusion protein)
VRIVLEEHRGLAVPRSALGRRLDGDVVYTVQDGRATEVAVTPGLGTDGWVQLLDYDLSAGDTVVTEGRFLLNDGAPVDVLASRTEP